MKKLIFIFAAVLILCGTNLLAECVSGNCIDGKGTYRFPSGSRYVGDFKEGKFHGEGTFFFYNGSQYSGRWISGEMSGKGTWRYSNGMKLKADFADGKVKGDATPDPVVIYDDFNFVSSLLPEGTDAVLVMKSINDFFTQFPITENTVFGNKIEKKKIDRIRSRLGFNPLSSKELEVQGIDLTRQVGIAFSDINLENSRRPSTNMVLCIPVKKDPRIIGTIKAILKKISRNQVRYELEGDVLKILSKRDRKRITKSFCMASRNGYLFLGHNPNGNVVPYVNKIMERKSPLSSTDIYKDVVNHMNTGEEVFMYIDGRKFSGIYSMLMKQATQSRGVPYRQRMMMNMYGSMMKNAMKSMDDYRGVGMTLDYDGGDFVIRSYSTLKADSELLKMYRDISYNKKNLLGMRSKPVAIFSMGLNVKEYVNYILKSLPPFLGMTVQGKMREFKKKENIDIQVELIDNLGGNINAGFFQASKFTRDNMGIFFTANVKDPGVMKGLMKKVIAGAPKGKIKPFKLGRVKGNILVGKKVKVFFGMSGNNLVVALSKPVFLASMKPRMSRSFLYKIDPEVAKILKKEGNVLYIDGNEFMKAINNFTLSGKKKAKTPREKRKDEVFKRVMKDFYYLYLYSYNVENKFYLKMMLKTVYDEPFFFGISSLIRDVEKIEKKGRSAASKSAPAIMKWKEK